jgi:diaminopimelate epimerase
MKPIGSNRLEVRTYERGVEDETLACGTGAIACALTAAVRGMASSPVKVKTTGGEELTIYFERRGDAFEDVYLEGSTSIIYQAHLNPEAL